MAMAIATSVINLRYGKGQKSVASDRMERQLQGNLTSFL